MFNNILKHLKRLGAGAAAVGGISGFLIGLVWLLASFPQTTLSIIFLVAVYCVGNTIMEDGR
jgi:hypothetical protein